MKRIRLFCLPYAGGSALVYQAWKPHLHWWIDLVPVELAGRGRRLSEPLYGSFDQAVEDVIEAVRPHLDEMPYAVFGHSMGCWLAFELYHRLAERGRPLPVHVFLSARRAPHIPYSGIILHALPDREFIEELARLGGTPRKLLEHEEYRTLFLNIVRADMKITETYRYVERGRKIACPVTVLNGREDYTVKVQELLAWRSLVAGPCTICNLDGGHFFLTQNIEGVIRVIHRALETCLPEFQMSL